MRNRILSLIIAAILLLSSAGIVYASPGAITDDVMYMYEMLKSLNVMDDPNTEPVIVRHTFKLVTGATGADTTDYGLFREVSKRNFINYVCNMLDDYGFTSEYSEDAIKILENAGVIHSNQDDLYKPLVYEEAVTMLVRLLSYGDIAEDGGWPYGYMTIASRLGLNDGVNAAIGQEMTMSDVIRLLYNTLNAPYAQMEYITNDGIVYSATSDTTFLYECRKIYKIEGIVESTGTAALSTELPVQKDRIMIGGYIYATEKDFTDMLGMSVEAYVKEDKSDIDTVLSVIADDDDELVIQTENIKTVTDDTKTVTYYDGNKERDARISQSASVIYNGQPLSSYTKDTFKPLDGNLRLINNDGSTGYDVVFITDYKTYVVDYVSTSTKMIKNKYTLVDPENVTLDMEEKTDDVIIIIAEDGTDIGLEDVKKGDVLRVAKSVVNGKKVIFAEQTRATLTGMVEQIMEKEKTILTISGAKYELSNWYRKALEVKDKEAEVITTGKEYVFYFDSAGRVAYATEASGVEKYGLVMGVSTDGAFEADSRIKIFTTSGDWEEYTFADKVEFNGEKGQVGSSVAGQIPTGINGEISLVKYVLNSKGEIKSIETPKPYSEATYDDFNVRTNVTNKYRPNNTSFESDVFLANGATLFLVETDNLSSEDSYALTSTTGLSNDNDHTINAYNLDRFGFAELIVVHSNESLKNFKLGNSDLFIVKSVGICLDANGDETGMVTGMMGAYEELTYYCDDMNILNRLSVGDVISVTTDKNGKIVYLPDANIYYSVADGTVKEDWANGIHTINTILKGTVTENDVSNLRMMVDCGTIQRVVRTDSGTMVVIYDLEKGTVRRGSIGDIEEQAQVVMKVRQSKLMCVVVYQ